LTATCDDVALLNNVWFITNNMAGVFSLFEPLSRKHKQGLLLLTAQHTTCKT